MRHALTRHPQTRGATPRNPFAAFLRREVNERNPTQGPTYGGGTAHLSARGIPHAASRLQVLVRSQQLPEAHSSAMMLLVDLHDRPLDVDLLELRLAKLLHQGRHPRCE